VAVFSVTGRAKTCERNVTFNGSFDAIWCQDVPFCGFVKKLPTPAAPNFEILHYKRHFSLKTRTNLGVMRDGMGNSNKQFIVISNFGLKIGLKENWPKITEAAV